MNNYYLFMFFGSVVVTVSEAIFLALWRPCWKVRKWWWSNFMLYALSLALLAVGIRTSILYASRLYPPNESSLYFLVSNLAANDAFRIFTALMFIIGSVVHVVAFLVNRHKENA